jgi:hypothetical protein
LKIISLFLYVDKFQYPDPLPVHNG